MCLEIVDKPVQLSLFGSTIIKSVMLKAQSPKMAWYKITLEYNPTHRSYFIKKESGTHLKILDNRTWKFDSYAQAKKYFLAKIKQKTSQRKSSPRVYSIVKKE